MLNKKEVVPPTIRLAFSDLRPVSEASYYKVYEATQKRDNQRYMIRTIDLESRLYKEHRDIAITLFTKELVRLCLIDPDFVLYEYIEISQTNAAFVTKPYFSLSNIAQNKLPTVNLEKMISDIAEDFDFISSKMKIIDAHARLENIFCIGDSHRYFLSDWTSNEEVKRMDDTQFQDLTTRETEEIFSLALSALKSCGIASDSLECLEIIKDNKCYTTCVNTFVDGLRQPKEMKKLLKRMLDRNPSKRPKLKELSQKIQGEQDQKGPIEPEAKKIQEKFPLKVARYQMIRDVGWTYGKEVNIDGISFKSTKNIQIIGIGFYALLWEGKLSGTVSIIPGRSIFGKEMYSQEFEVTDTYTEGKERIVVIKFKKSIEIKADAHYSIVSTVKKCGTNTLSGSSQKKIIEGEGGVTFEFVDFDGCNNGTNWSMGQLPEIYYYC